MSEQSNTPNNQHRSLRDSPIFLIGAFLVGSATLLGAVATALYYGNELKKEYYPSIHKKDEPVARKQDTAAGGNPSEDGKTTSAPVSRPTSPQVAEVRRPKRPPVIIPRDTGPATTQTPVATAATATPTVPGGTPAPADTPTTTSHRFTRSTLTWTADLKGATEVVLQQPSIASVGKVVNGKLPGENCRITVLDGSAQLQQPSEGPCRQLHFRVNGQGLTKVTFEVHLTSYHP